MADSEFDELKRKSLRRQRFKVNLFEFETSIKKLMDLDVSLPVILEWLVEEKKVSTTLPALRRFVKRILGDHFYDSYTARNGWKKSKIQHGPQSRFRPSSKDSLSMGGGKGKVAESTAASSFESMLDGKQRDDFTKQYLPLNPLINKGK